VAAAWYLALTSVLSVGQGYIERYYGRGSNRGQTGARLLRRRTAQETR
jgi:polar amino acid transport system permease protein